MPEEAPSIPDHPNLDELLPSDSNKSTMKEFLPFMWPAFFAEDFGDVIPEHLDHPMSSEMSRRSRVVSICLTFNILSA